MTCFGALGGFCFKKISPKKDSFFALLMDKYLFLGALAYVLGAVINIYLLKFLNFSIVYPLGVLTYFWTYIFAILFLHEKLFFIKIIGLLLILIGVFFVVL